MPEQLAPPFPNSACGPAPGLPPRSASRRTETFRLPDGPLSSEAQGLPCPEISAATSTDSFGLYISVPFCRAKCTFCNFASGVYPLGTMPAYVAALTAQVRSARAWALARGLVLSDQIDTIYLGGGTPSLLPPVLVTELIGSIRQEFNVAPDAEITLEAAPLQLEPATLEAALRTGVNRISFGVQSFVDGEARATARTHSGAEALQEIERVCDAGVPHISADLIAGLPGQTRESWARSVEMLAAAPLDHASVYMFELDEESRLGAEALGGGVRYGAQLLPSEDAVADWYLQACQRLPAAGLQQYEISNFARSAGGRDGRSRHNERYWLRRPYLGLGVDAHSMLRAVGGGDVRFASGTAVARRGGRARRPWTPLPAGLCHPGVDPARTAALQRSVWRAASAVSVRSRGRQRR